MERTLSIALAALAGCAEAPAPESRPDVLLVTFDTLRADHCTVYGYERPTTPNLERTASGGVTFQVAYAPVGATCPSHATLFTSKFPLEHGVVRNGLELVAEEDTLPELLAESGWSTAAFVSSFPVSRRFGFASGFEHYDDHFPLGASKLDLHRWSGAELTEGFDRRAEGTTAAALDWLQTNAARDEPIFTWMHYFDPHYPYLPLPELAEKFPPRGKSRAAILAAAYDAEIARADRALGRVLAAWSRQRPERELFAILTSDHGECLLEHGYAGHNRTMYEEELRVPLVLRWDGRLPAGLRIDEPAHLIDVAPTIAAALGLTFDGARGRDLLAAEGPRESERALFFQRPGYPGGRPRFQETGAAYGVRVGDWKLTESVEEGWRRLYDLSRDPDEQRDRSALDPDRAGDLSARLAGWLEQQAALGGDRDLKERPEDMEGLRALGYVDEGD